MTRSLLPPTIFCMVLSTMAWAQHSPQRAGHEQDKPLSPIGFTATAASMAGVMRVCQPPVAISLHDCVAAMLANWHVMTGQPTMTQTDLAFAEGIWGGLFKDAVKEQSSKTPPYSCSQAIAIVQVSSIWNVCPSPWALGGLSHAGGSGTMR